MRRPADADRQRLRELAIALVREGCAIQPPRAAYVHLDEVRLLHFVADVQAGRTLTGVPDPEKALIAEIGAILAKTGIRPPGAASYAAIRRKASSVQDPARIARNLPSYKSENDSQ